MNSLIKFNYSLILVLLFLPIFSFSQQPEFRWAFHSAPTSYNLSVDKFENTYTALVTDNYSINDFGNRNYSFNATSGGPDIFFYKVDALGNILWVKQIKIDGFADNSVNSTLDKAGNYYLTSAFSGVADFNPGLGVDTISSGSYPGNAIFVAK